MGSEVIRSSKPNTETMCGTGLTSIKCQPLFRLLRETGGNTDDLGSGLPHFEGRETVEAVTETGGFNTVPSS